MGAIQTAWAWNQQGISPDEKLVLLALAEDSNHKNQCWPSRTVMVERTCLSEDTIARSLAILRGLGLLDSHEPAAGAHHYFLRLETVTHRKAKRVVAPISAEPSQAAMMERAVATWNEAAKRTAAGPKEHRLPLVRKLTADMQAKLATRLNEGGIDLWATAVAAVEHSSHCRGINDRNWRADFHYLLQAKGFSKSINGGWKPDYEEVSYGGTRIGPAGRGDQRFDHLRRLDRNIRGGAAERDGLRRGGQEDHGQPEVARRSPGEAESHLPLGRSNPD